MERPSHWEHLFRDARIGLAYGSFTDYRFVFVNDAFAQQRGYRTEELIGKSLFSVIASNVRDAAESRIKEIRRRGRLVFESVHRRKDGMTFPVLVEVAAVKEAQTDSDSWVAYALDISERKEADARLCQSEERFRLVAEVTNDVLWDWDLTTDGRWWSPNAQEKFGYDPTKEPGIAAWRSRLHPHDRKRVLSHVAECVKSKERAFFDEYKFLLADGSYGVFWDKGRVVYDSEGKAIRMIGTMIDVTAAKRAYTSLEQAYVRLQWLSRELQRAEETERRRLSRELHDEFGQLLSALRFSLGRVTEELAKRPRAEGSVLGKNVMAATKAADRLSASLRELVHGLRHAVLDEFGLVAALRSMVEDIRQGAGLDCRLSVEPKNVHSMIGQELEGPLFRIAQEVVTNVVRHAKATRAGIRLRYVDGMIVLTVHDNGRGGRFAEPKKGYGLRGIYERTELLGGQVEIRSELRRGTIVTVTFPIEPLRRHHGPIASGRPTMSAKTRKLPHGKKV